MFGSTTSQVCAGPLHGSAGLGPQISPVWQSELLLHAPHIPLLQLPWPLQSELLLQWPHWPLEQLPTPAQS